EPVTWMDGVGSAAGGDVQHLPGVQVGFGGGGYGKVVCNIAQAGVQSIAVRVGVHTDGADSCVRTGAGDPDGDLSAVSDQNLRDRPSSGWADVAGQDSSVSAVCMRRSASWSISSLVAKEMRK